MFNTVNCLPEVQRDVDIMRVKEWCLGGQSRHYRQTILLSSFVSAELNALFSRTCVNHGGKARLKPVHKVGLLIWCPSIPEDHCVWCRVCIERAGPLLASYQVQHSASCPTNPGNLLSLVWVFVRAHAGPCLAAVLSRLRSAYQSVMGHPHLNLTVQGVLGRVLAPIRQLFEQIEVSTAGADADARFQHFKSQIWPRIKEAGNSGDMT